MPVDHVADIPRLLETIRVLHDHFIIFRRGTHLQTLALAHRAALLQRQLLPAHVCDIRFSPTSKYVAFAAETLLSFAAETLLRQPDVTLRYSPSLLTAYLQQHKRMRRLMHSLTTSGNCLS